MKGPPVSPGGPRTGKARLLSNTAPEPRLIDTTDYDLIVMIRKDGHVEVRSQRSNSEIAELLKRLHHHYTQITIPPPPRGEGPRRSDVA